MTVETGNTTKPAKQKKSAASKAAPNNEQRQPKAARVEEHTEAARRDLRLGFLIHDVSRMRRKAFDQFMKPLGVTRTQWWVLAHLSRHDGMMQTQLADILEVGKASLGTVIERLEAAGLIERRPDPVDKRAKRIYLARNAQNLLETMGAYERAFNEQILSGLNADDRKQLANLLFTVKQSLSKMDIGEAGPEDE